MATDPAAMQQRSRTQRLRQAELSAQVAAILATGDPLERSSMRRCSRSWSASARVQGPLAALVANLDMLLMDLEAEAPVDVTETSEMLHARSER